ncbi:MAG TPA: hypothetical protein PKE14_10770 [Chitinophagales bacterium]|nr:hypothetical protein [Chitinophagales bacterium]HNE46372.1 hypothetical protein [Chitinophagales bacterium]
MKKIFFLLCICMVLYSEGVSQNLGYTSKYLKTVSLSDSLSHQISFYNKHKIAAIGSFKYHADSKLIRFGYQYDFYKNGRLKQISFYRNGVKSDFEILFDKKGRYYSFKDLVNGTDFLQTIEKNVSAIAKNDHDINYLTVGYLDNGLTIEYDHTNGEIRDMYLHSSDRAIMYSQKNGLFIYFDKGEPPLQKITVGIKSMESLYILREANLQ